jgi:GDP-L-fucose synthase
MSSPPFIIVVTGGSGLIGKALQSIQSQFPLYDFYFLSSKDCNLLSFEETFQTFQDIQPHIILHFGANVGGLFKNMNQKVSMFEDNILMNMNVLKCAHLLNIQHVISCLSTCIFPDKTTYPINESMLHEGPPHTSNDAYAYAKRMLEIQSRCYQENYGRNYRCIIPTNIYGPHDNFHLEDGHVIPALIHQCYLSKMENRPFIIKGSGKPLRQFIYSIDLARLIMWMAEEYPEREPIILSVDEKDEISIGEVGRLIAKYMDYDKIEMDESYADGQYKKTADNSKLRKYLPHFQFTSIENGLEKTIEWFLSHYPNLRK